MQSAYFERNKTTSLCLHKKLLTRFYTSPYFNEDNSWELILHQTGSSFHNLCGDPPFIGSPYHPLNFSSLWALLLYFLGETCCWFLDAIIFLNLLVDLCPKLCLRSLVFVQFVILVFLGSIFLIKYELCVKTPLCNWFGSGLLTLVNITCTFDRKMLIIIIRRCLHGGERILRK